MAHANSARLPLNALRAFEAAARLLSFKAAAEELHITPTSVSNQIRQLERDWNCPLFVRKARQVELTDEGRALAAASATAFDSLRKEIEKIMAPQRRKVSVGVGPIFGARWLIPRLDDFAACHTDIELTLQQGRHIDQTHKLDTDLAIDWGDESQRQTDWTGLFATRLLNVHYTPVLSPALARKLGPINTVADLVNTTIIHQQDKSAWDAWLACSEEAATAKLTSPHSIVMADSNMAMQAAIDGQGVALGILPMVEAEVQSGALVCPFASTLQPKQAYYLLCREATLPASAVDVVKRWLLAQTASST